MNQFHKPSAEAAKRYPSPSMSDYSTAAEFSDAHFKVDILRATFDAFPAPEKLDAIGIEVICKRIADRVTLQVIADDAGVLRSSLIAWLDWLDGHSDQYASAKELLADSLVDDILGAVTGEIAADMVELTKLQIETRKWLAAQLAPNKYGKEF